MIRSLPRYRAEGIWSRGLETGILSLIMKLSDIFSEGSEARRLFGKVYAFGAIGVILLSLLLLALATRGG